jgi:uncharacterized protein (TIGR02594 family)
MHDYNRLWITRLRNKSILLACALSGCIATTKPDEITVSASSAQLAHFFVGYHERRDRAALKDLTGVDPVRTEWCAAFVNAILLVEGVPGSESVSANPLLARSFLFWGEPVLREEIQRGDIVVFPRGSAEWQGHVGFYIDTVWEDDVEYWRILGGNQDNTVSYALYKASRAITVRRHKVKLYGLDE